MTDENIAEFLAHAAIVLAGVALLGGGIHIAHKIFGPPPLVLLQDKVQVGDCIASKMPDFGSPQKMYSDKYFRVTSKGRDGVVVDILITEDYGKTYTLAGERHLYWTDINLTYTIYQCP